MNEDGQHAEQHSVSFNSIAWYERVRRVTSYLPEQIPLFAAVTASFWGVAEVLSEIAGEVLPLRTLAGPALLTAFVVALYRAVRSYMDYVPEALISETESCRKIYRGGSLGWQFALANEMLKERIERLNRVLRRIDNGAQFIFPRHLAGAQYLTWLKERPEVLLRLVRSITMQCTLELPEILARTSKEADLVELRDSVEQLALLYEEAIEFELSVRGVKPLEELTEAHRMMFGWSSPLREGISDFLDILVKISRFDAKRHKEAVDEIPSFSMEFKSIPNIDEFLEAIHSVDASIFE